MSSSSFCPQGKADDLHVGGRGERKKTKTALDVSAQVFLDHLGLPMMHPLCDDDDHRDGDYDAGGDGAEADDREIEYLVSRIDAGSIFELPHLDAAAELRGAASSSSSSSSSTMPPPPMIGSTPLLELHDHSVSELLLTLTTMTAPTLAMMELWLRFFAIFLCPLCLCYSIQREITAITAKASAAETAARATPTTKTTEATRDSCKTSNEKSANDKEINNAQGERKGGGDVTTTTTTMQRAVCVVGLASSAVIFTDSLYVYEYGRWFGLSLFVLSSMMAVRCAFSAPTSVATTVYRCAITLLIAITIVVYLKSDGGDATLEINLSTLRRFSASRHASKASAAAADIMLKSHKNPLRSISHPGIDLPSIDEGLYRSKSNTLIASIVSHWPEPSRTYDVENGATPYLVNGDQRTGIPFVLNRVDDQEYVRVWTRNQYDGEYLALDIAFPYSNHINNTGSTLEEVKEGQQHFNDDDERIQKIMFVHDLTRPVYLLLHGLNGGSHEQYIKDMVRRRREEGSTVVVLIARGMMDTRLVQWNTFHGARTGDVDVAARALRDGLTSLADAHHRQQRQILAGVGYSMGAIILSNYVARSGSHCALDAAMSISGGLDMRQQINAKRSMRLWQPILTFGLREDIILGKYGRHYKARLTRDQLLGLLRATSISVLDVEAIVTYNSFDSLFHYYSEMSAMGDREPEFQLFDQSESVSTDNKWGRVGNVSIPFTVLQALDDPLVGWRTVGTNDPQGLANSGSGNVMLLLTKAGGHVGWPLGKNPAKYSWEWMNNAARDFVVAVDIAINEVGRDLS